MKKVNLWKTCLLLMVGAMVMSSCTTTLITYAAENIKGNGVMDEANMLADYGKFAIQYNYEGDVVIINKSDSTLYIDMGESYYMLNGEAQQLFSNSVTTNFSSSTRGATMNMGSVANALGVGGAVGTLARGVNVSGSNTNGSSTQVFEERVISIPPMSRKAMKSASFSAPESQALGDVLYKSMNSSKLVSRKKIAEYYYDKYSVPAHEYVFAYSFDPNALKFQSTRDLFYIESIVADKNLRYAKANKNQAKRWDLTWGGNCAAWFGVVVGTISLLTVALAVIATSA